MLYSCVVSIEAEDDHLQLKIGGGKCNRGGVKALRNAIIYLFSAVLKR